MLFALIAGLYLVAVHYATISENPYPAALALLALLACGLYPQLRRASVPAWLSLLAVLSATALLLRGGQLLQLLYFLPIVVNLMLLLTFGRTLLAGETPLVTRIALAIGDPASDELLVYTRRVTRAWTGFFAAMVVESLLLAFYASPQIWSLFTNFLNYLFIGAFFVLEYALRRRLLDLPDRGGFLGFLRSLKNADFKRLARRQPAT